MTKTILEEYRKCHDRLHLSSGRTEEYIKTQSDFNKETDQINMFLEVLSELDVLNVDKPIMIELGAGRFPTYSKCFTDVFPGGRSICTEVRTDYIKSGKKTLPGSSWYHCYSGKPRHAQEKKPDEDQLGNASMMSMAKLFEKENLSNEAVHILHMDIQGSETDVLYELNETGLYKNIKCLFVAIHDHSFGKCEDILDSWNVKYRFKHPTVGGYGDGLIVATHNFG